MKQENSASLEGFNISIGEYKLVVVQLEREKVVSMKTTLILTPRRQSSRRVTQQQIRRPRGEKRQPAPSFSSILVNKRADAEIQIATSNPTAPTKHVSARKSLVPIGECVTGSRRAGESTTPSLDKSIIVQFEIVLYHS